MASSSPRTPPPLVDVLKALPASELASLMKRLGVRVDPAKRLDPPQQVARVLVSLPELRDPSRLPRASIELMHRVAEARGVLVLDAVPAALEPLAARGLMFARAAGGAKDRRVELLMPPAYLVQLRAWEGEDPRGLRALLAQAPFEAVSAIAGHYLGRPATPPVALALETAWQLLSDPERLAEEVEKLPASERRLLDAIEQLGGEVETDELLELEREPMRLRTASGATPSRRGIGFSLERRGLLVPIHPNRHVVPSEVARIVGAGRHAEQAKRRAAVRAFVSDGDHAPRRARFSVDPAPLALALAIAVREPGGEVRPGVGTPKSLLAKLATRFGREPVHVALVVALSRAVGLWDGSATSTSAPPGALAVADVGRLLFDTWRRGGAWDEARPEPEMLRVPPDAREPSPSGMLRELVLDALRELGEDRWIPWSSLDGFLRTDERTKGLARLLARWSERTGVEAPSPLDVAERIVRESLPALGVVDVGEADGDDDGDDGGLTLRVSPRGRAWLADRPVPGGEARSKFLDAHVLRIGEGAKVHQVLALLGLADVGRVDQDLDLLVAPQTLARALSLGFEADALRARIEALCPLPETLSRTLAQASVVVGRATYTPASGFLWIEDASVRELLRTRRGTQELFVDPSPPAGLLLAAGVDLERVARRARTVGVEILAEGEVVRARSIPPPTGGSAKYARTTTGSLVVERPTRNVRASNDDD